MLRRHLRSGAAPVASCAGFDLDAASAYLEGALDEWRRESYESHLAGCAICRRHLIELSRVAQAAPSFESRPAATPGRIPAWNRLKETVASWFDLSSWNLKWQIAGATGAAFLILISALGVQLWRRAPYPQEISLNGASAASQPAAEKSAQGYISPTPEPPPQEADTPGDQNLIASRSKEPAIPVPAATVRSIENPTTLPVEVAGKVVTLDSNLSIEAPPATRTRGAEAGRSDSNKAIESGLEDFRANPKQFVATIDTAPGAQDLPPYQGNLVKNKPETPSKAPAKKTIPQQAIDSAREMLRRSVNPLRKGFTESERKEIPDTQEAQEDEQAPGMEYHLRGEVFRRGEGLGIDPEN